MPNRVNAGHPAIPACKKSPAMKYHDKLEKIEALFGTGAGKFVESLPGQMGSIDVCGLDDWFKQKYGDYEDDRTSMKDFVNKQFGAEACTWLEANMDSVS